MADYDVLEFKLVDSINYPVSLLDKIRMFFGQRIFFFGVLFEEGEKKRIHMTYKSFSWESAIDYAAETIKRDITGKTFYMEELCSHRKSPLKKVWVSTNQVSI